MENKLVNEIRRINNSNNNRRNEIVNRRKNTRTCKNQKKQTLIRRRTRKRKIKVLLITRSMTLTSLVHSVILNSDKVGMNSTITR